MMQHYERTRFSRNPGRGGTRRYIVMVREVHVQPTQVMAVSEEDAIRRVREGEGDLIPDSLEYSHTLAPEYWTVEG